MTNKKKNSKFLNLLNPLELKRGSKGKKSQKQIGRSSEEDKISQMLAN